MTKQLRAQLIRVQQRLRTEFRWIRFASMGTLGAVLVGLLLLSDQAIETGTLAWIAGVLVAMCCLVGVVSRRHFGSTANIARRVEQKFPELQQRLLTAVGTLERAGNRPLGYLESTVVDEAVTHGQRVGWENLVPSARLRILQLIAGVTLALTAAGFWQLSKRSVPTAAITPPRPAATPEIAADVAVEPGNADVERGTPLIFSAQFSGRVPRDATLRVQTDLGEIRQLPMSRRLDDPLFAVQWPEVREALTYRVEYLGKRTRDYRIDVFDYPDLLQADANLDYPGYTGLDPKEIEDTRRVTAVEGSQLTWLARVNKPLKRAWLRSPEGQEIALQQETSDSQAYRVRVELMEDARWELHLEDEQGRRNKVAPELVARVFRNQPPTLKPTLARDVSVSPLEEVEVNAECRDDFGITRYGIAYGLAAQPMRDYVLGQNVAAQLAAQAAYLLDFESLEAEPDQLLAYHFWAEDVGPDGQPRRTQSDLYFAEVRHFEEIFREGQSPPGGQPPPGAMSQNGQQAEQLMELQKQIINATWTLLRRETSPTLSSEFESDLALLQQSQRQAEAQLQALQEKLQDAESLGHARLVAEAMEEALAHLQASLDQHDASLLNSALAAEQAAYQGLLRLRAREHEVVRGQPQQAGASGASASSQQRQQQLQELELENETRRYETQQQASADEQQQAAERDLQQILNRLRDLARRQEDINKQLQELQTALQQAVDEQRREELERQLKRLRDQQEEMLRDTDETLERVSQSPNQQQLQETRQQLEQSRERLQQSNQSASEGNVAEALAAGTRAERQFQEMSDQLRKKTANQFGEQMQSMREQARELDERQQKLADQLQGESQDGPGLRPSDSTQPIQDELQRQEARLQSLVERMQETIQAAETAEPLLAQKLYDTLRDANQKQLNDRLQNLRELLDNGLREAAVQAEPETREGIQGLRQGVDQAAESILGDDLEGLRRAASQLSELASELNRELERFEPADPENESASESTPSQPGQQQPGEQQSGQQQSGQQQSGQQQSGQQQSGQQQSGQQQSGQQQSGQQQSGQQQSGQQQSGQQQSGQQQSGQQQSGQQQSGQQQSGQQQSAASPGPQGSSGGGGGSSAGREQGGGLLEQLEQGLQSGPLTGDQFGQWYDRLRDVEEMIDDPELRARAAQIRDRARSMRREMRRHSELPQWDLVRDLVATPLDELRQEVQQELARRSGQQDELVPIDRDPVPLQFSERVRKYYEQLGQGE